MTGVLLTSLGTRSGLWAALAGAGPLTTADVAAKVSVEPSLVREWLRAQAAGGYLVYDPATGTFTLPDAVAAAICYGPGGALVDAAATMFSSMGEGFAAFSEAFSTGQGFGERRAAALLRRQAGPAARLQGPGRHRGADRGAGSRHARSRLVGQTVSARVRDALAKIGQVHPELADHLRGSLRMGTVCAYSPAEPVTWKVR